MSSAKACSNIAQSQDFQRSCSHCWRAICIIHIATYGGLYGGQAQTFGKRHLYSMKALAVLHMAFLIHRHYPDQVYIYHGIPFLAYSGSYIYSVDGK